MKNNTEQPVSRFPSSADYNNYFLYVRVSVCVGFRVRTHTICVRCACAHAQLGHTRCAPVAMRSSRIRSRLITRPPISLCDRLNRTHVPAPFESSARTLAPHVRSAPLRTATGERAAPAIRCAPEPIIRPNARLWGRSRTIAPV